MGGNDLMFRQAQQPPPAPSRSTPVGLPSGEGSRAVVNHVPCGAWVPGLRLISASTPFHLQSMSEIRHGFSYKTRDVRHLS